MSNTRRSTTFKLAITTSYLLLASALSTITLHANLFPAPDPDIFEALNVDEFSTEEQELVDFAYSRFALVGIELPAVRIEFPDDKAACHEFGGVYLPGETTVRICRPSRTTLIHELAHSWVETTLNATDRDAFLEERGLDTWAGGTQWDKRGAEHAAEIITWAVMEENISIPWLVTNPDGTFTRTWRLLKISQSDPDQLAAAFEQLTDDVPVLRLADDPRQADPALEMESPEARRR